jgi:23S rRNA (adenine2503-C2)-methyltransferase
MLNSKKYGNILDYSVEELRDIMLENGEKGFRAKQIFDWIYKKNVKDFSSMTSLSYNLRNFLKENFYYEFLEKVEVSSSESSQTTKYLFKLPDGNTIESVLLFYKDRTTACISSQVGCPLKCKFCATGKGGLTRNLSTGEILNQILSMEYYSKTKITHIVYMGMGEPFLNYDNVLKSIEILRNTKGLSARKITISTSGIVPKIREFTDLNTQIRLAVSLHAPNDYLRNRLMPINKKYPIVDLFDSLMYYQNKTQRRITFEYIMIKGINDTTEIATELANLIKNFKIKCNINLIPLNPVDDELKRSSPKAIRKFMKVLRNAGIEVVVREEKGTEINGACGQLRSKKIEE